MQRSRHTIALPHLACYQVFTITSRFDSTRFADRASDGGLILQNLVLNRGDLPHGPAPPGAARALPRDIGRTDAAAPHTRSACRISSMEGGFAILAALVVMGHLAFVIFAGSWGLFRRALASPGMGARARSRLGGVRRRWPAGSGPLNPARKTPFRNKGGGLGWVTPRRTFRGLRLIWFSGGPCYPGKKVLDPRWRTAHCWGPIPGPSLRHPGGGHPRSNSGGAR